LNESAIIMHELGHNLGLCHGGHHDVPYKPNYLSIMNPTYITEEDPYTKLGTWGLNVNGVTGVLDYSRLEVSAVSEIEGLNEEAGFSPAAQTTTEADLEGYGVYIRKKGWIDNGIDGASANLDFNHNQSIQTSVLNPGVTDTDLNGDSDESDSFTASQNDWSILVFDGRQIGEGNETLNAPTLDVTCLDN